MIDTIKIYAKISDDIFTKIKMFSNIKTMINLNENKIYYEIINDSLEGSYSSSLSVRVDER